MSQHMKDVIGIQTAIKNGQPYYEIKGAGGVTIDQVPGRSQALALCKEQVPSAFAEVFEVTPNGKTSIFGGKHARKGS